MSDEKGGSIVFVLAMLACAILWSNQPTKPKVEPSPMPSDLIDQVASIDHFRDATKMVDEPKPAPSPSDKPSKPEIIIFMGVNCPPCERWKRCEMQKFLDLNWKVVIVDQKDHSYPRTPTFQITKDGKTVERVGFFTFDQLGEVWK